MRSLASLMNLTGRRALITGGAGHVGVAAAESLLELGATVGLVDRDAGACAARVAELGPRAHAFPCELSDEQAARATVRDATERFGGLDILIHCAAYVGTTQLAGWSAPFADQSVAAWDSAFRVNLTAAFVLAQEAQPALAASKRGSILLISSIYGIVGPDLSLYDGTAMANPAGYGASKAGLLQLTRYLATILAPTVRVNALSPGGISRGQPGLFRQRYEARTPLKRMAVEEDLKGAVAYLASDLSAYVTGQNLVVDGGWTAW